MDYEYDVQVINPELNQTINSWARMDIYTDDERNERAKIQQEIGSEILPSVFNSVQEGKLRPYYALSLAGGIRTENEELYRFSKSILFLPETYLDLDKSAFNNAIEYMCATSRDRDQLSQDLEELRHILFSDEKEWDYDTERAIDIIDYTIENYESSKEDSSAMLESERSESEAIYQMGYEQYTQGVYGSYDSYDPEPGEYEDHSHNQDEETGLREVLASLASVMKQIQLLDIRSGKEGYLLFDEEEERYEIVQIGRKISEYVHSLGIQDIIFVDRSARPGYISVLENWKHLYPSEKPPTIYFMNPKGFRSTDDLQNYDQITEDLMNSVAKDDKLESPELVRSKQNIHFDLRTTYPNLFGKGEKHVLLFDTCIHSGNSVRPIVEELTDMGLDVRLAVVRARDSVSEIEADLVIMDETQDGGCYPFDKDQLVDKTYTSVHSLPSKDQEKQLLSRQIRKEIRLAVTEYYSGQQIN